MEKILKYLNKLPYDKALHVLYGLIIYSLIALYSADIAIVIVMCTAVGKELYDSYHKDIHTADGYATLLGKFQNLINKIQAYTTVANVAKVVG